MKSNLLDTVIMILALLVETHPICVPVAAISLYSLIELIE